MEQITWFSKKQYESKSDVTISKRLIAGEIDAYVIKFRNGYENVCVTGYTKIGISKAGNRIYFSEASERTGWKLGVQKGTGNTLRTAVSDKNLYPCFERFTGDFNANKVNDKVFYIGERKINGTAEDEVYWFTKFSEPKSRAKVELKDVSVTLRANGRIAITLRNGIKHEFKSEYIRVGLSTDGKKLYFLASNDKSGWKLYKINDTSAYITLPNDKKLYMFMGDYDIEISDDNLLYIDSRNRK